MEIRTQNIISVIICTPVHDLLSMSFFVPHPMHSSNTSTREEGDISICPE